MRFLKTIIADDESLIRERIIDLLSEYEEVNIVSACQNGADTIEAINEHQPDILFLDIKMPNFSGFEVLERVNTKKTLLIFITAYDQYALKAFDYAAFDYIVKPIDAKRFQKTIYRAIEYYKSADGSKSFTINVRENGVTYKLKTNEISHLEAADNYVHIHTAKRVYKKRATLTEVVKSLSEYNIIRVHRSYAINCDHIDNMARIYKGDYLIKMKNGKIIPTSQSYSNEVKRLLL